MVHKTHPEARIHPDLTWPGRRTVPMRTRRRSSPFPNRTSST